MFNLSAPLYQSCSRSHRLCHAVWIWRVPEVIKDTLLGISWVRPGSQKVKTVHPQGHCKIWKQRVESLIAETTVKSYKQAAPFLRKAQTLLEKSGQQKEWEVYLKKLRTTHARKWRLLEVLDGLGGKRG